MNQYNVHSILESVARNNNTSVDTVIQEIETAIETAIAAAKQNGDQERLAYWMQIPRRGDTPTAEELLRFLIDQIPS